MERTIWMAASIAALALVAGCNDSKAENKLENAGERTERAVERGSSSGSESLEKAEDKTKDASDKAGDQVEGGANTFHDKVERVYDDFGRKIDNGK